MKRETSSTPDILSSNMSSDDIVLIYYIPRYFYDYNIQEKNIQQEKVILPESSYMASDGSFLL